MIKTLNSKFKSQRSKVQVSEACRFAVKIQNFLSLRSKGKLCLFLSCSFAFCILTFALASFPVFAQSEEAVDKGIGYLRTQQQSNGQISGFNGTSAWASMAFSGAGIDIASISNGGSSLLDFLKNNPPAEGAAATDWEREILAITSAGENPFNFGSRNYVLALESFSNNSQIGNPDLINDDMFGLLALISAGNGSNGQIKQNALNFILDNQSPNGGFGYSKTSGPDIDTTAAAIQALRAAQIEGFEHNNLSSAINSARAYLLSGQNTGGGFGYLPGEVSNASTTAWAVMALSSLGGNTESVQKAENYLLETQEENGSFMWQPGFPGDTFTSSYAILALEGEYWPLRIFEAPAPSPSPSLSPSPNPSTSPPAGGSPSPSVNPSATPVSSPSPKPKPEIESEFNFKEMYLKQQELLKKLREKQKATFEKMEQRLNESLKDSCKNWSCFLRV